MESLQLHIDTKIDGHVHTRLCHHAVGEMEEYVQAALLKGLKKIVFLEHLEKGINYFESTWLSERDFDYYFSEGQRLQKQYDGMIEIGLGVEVGFNPLKIQEINVFLSQYDWERVGISYHFLAAEEFYANMVSRKQSNIDALVALGVDWVIEKYYLGLKQAIQDLPGTVLCHLDAVLRHHPHVNTVDHRDDLVCDVLDAVAEKKMALEVNTSGFTMRAEPFPSLRWIVEAEKRKIPLAAGSDAHRPDQVGRYFDRL